MPRIHHSLTDCSSIHRISCGAPVIDDSYPMINKSSDDNQRRPSITRRILTNGLLLSHCSSGNPTHRRVQPPLAFQQYRCTTKPKSEEKLSSLFTLVSPSSSQSLHTSESSSPANEKFMSRSDFILHRQQQNLSHQRKATSLKTISETSSQHPTKILYPIDFQTNNFDQLHFQKHSTSSNDTKVPTSDSGIVIDTAGAQQTSNSSIEDVSFKSFIIFSSVD